MHLTCSTSCVVWWDRRCVVVSAVAVHAGVVEAIYSTKGSSMMYRHTAPPSAIGVLRRFRWDYTYQGAYLPLPLIGLLLESRSAGGWLLLLVGDDMICSL